MVAGLLLAFDWRVIAGEIEDFPTVTCASPRELYRLQHKNVVLSGCTKERVAHTVRRQPADGSVARIARSYPLFAIILCFYANVFV